MRTESAIEATLALQMRAMKLPAAERNYRFIEGRKLELDFAWPQRKVAVEVQGMAHRIKEKFKRDIEKRALALFAGWRVLEVDGERIRSGEAIQWVERLLA